MAFPQITVGPSVEAPASQAPETEAEVQTNFWKGLQEGTQQRLKETHETLADQLEQERIQQLQQQLETQKRTVAAKEATEAFKEYLALYGDPSTWTPEDWSSRRGEFNSLWSNFQQHVMNIQSPKEWSIRQVTTPGATLPGEKQGPIERGAPTTLPDTTQELPMPVGGWPTASNLNMMTPEQLGISPDLVPAALYRMPLAQIERQPWGAEFIKFIMTHEPKVPANPEEATISQWIRDPNSLNPQQQQIIAAKQAQWAKEGTKPFGEGEFRVALLTQGEAYIGKFDPAVQPALRSLRSSMIPGTPEYNSIHGGNTGMRQQLSWTRNRMNKAKADYEAAKVDTQRIRNTLIANNMSAEQINAMGPGTDYGKALAKQIALYRIWTEYQSQYNDLLQNPQSQGAGPKILNRSQVHGAYLQYTASHPNQKISEQDFTNFLQNRTDQDGNPMYQLVP